MPQKRDQRDQALTPKNKQSDLRRKPRGTPFLSDKQTDQQSKYYRTEFAGCTQHHCGQIDVAWGRGCKSLAGGRPDQSFWWMFQNPVRTVT